MNLLRHVDRDNAVLCVCSLVKIVSYLLINRIPVSWITSGGSRSLSGKGAKISVSVKSIQLPQRIDHIILYM